MIRQFTPTKAIVTLMFAVVAAVPPAFGQDRAPTARPVGSDAPSAPTILDFSGVWTHPYFPGFEPDDSEDQTIQ